MPRTVQYKNQVKTAFSSRQPIAHAQRGRSTTSLAIGLAGLALLSGAIIWGFFADGPLGGSEADQSPIVVQSEPEPIEDPFEPVVPAEPIEEPEPEITAAEPEIATVEPELPAEPPEPELTLEDSDEAVRAAAMEMGGGPVAQQFIASSNLIERAVSLADNMAAGNVPYKLIPIARPKTAFPISDNGLRVSMDPAGFQRFNGLAEWINGLDAAAIAETYRRFEPLAEEAYALLGYNEGSMGERVDRALRLLLTVPEVPADAELIKQEAVWIYADESLEALPDLHKQLLRFGPDNLSIIQDKAREISYALEDSAT